MKVIRGISREYRSNSCLAFLMLRRSIMLHSLQQLAKWRDMTLCLYRKETEIQRYFND